MARGHAERLFSLIDAALTRAGVAPAALDAIAVCAGPGGFTGVRVGVAAARGLALALDRPAVGVDWFAALAAEAGPGAQRIALPAPRGGAWTQTLRDGVAEGPPQLTTSGDGDAAGWAARRAALGPAALARHAARLLAAGSPPPPAPLYLRPPDAIAAPPAQAATRL